MRGRQSYPTNKPHDGRSTEHRLDDLFNMLCLEDGDPTEQAASLPSPLPQTQWSGAANTAGFTVSASLQHTLPHDSVVCAVRYSWDGQSLASASNGAAHIYDAKTAQQVAIFSEHTDSQCDDGSGYGSYVRAVCFSPDGNSLVTGGEDHVVRIWDVHSGKLNHRLVGHGTAITSVDVSSNSRFIASGAGDRINLWGLETGNLLSTLGGYLGPVDGITSVSVSPNCQHIAAGSLDGVVRIWDVESMELVRHFEGHSAAVYSVAFSPDGRMLLSGSLDKTVKLWGLAASNPSSQCILSLAGHNDFVLSVAMSPDGRLLISGSKDRTVQLWDPRQTSIGLTITGHYNSVISVAHNPASRSFATGCGDCHARTWLYSS